MTRHLETLILSPIAPTNKTIETILKTHTIISRVYFHIKSFVLSAKHIVIHKKSKQYVHYWQIMKTGSVINAHLGLRQTMPEKSLIWRQKFLPIVVYWLRRNEATRGEIHQIRTLLKLSVRLYGWQCWMFWLNRRRLVIVFQKTQTQN